MPAPMQTATVRGRTVRYLQAGDPSATHVIVLVHAFPVGVRLFQPQQSAFPRWRVITPALPGFDGSDLLDRAHVDDYARHLLALLDELQVPRAVFAGVSMGGYLIFDVLRQAAHRAAAVVLADTRSGADTEEAREGRRRMIEIARTGGPPAVAEDMLPKLLSETTRRTRPQAVAEVRGMIEAQSAEAIVAAVEVLQSRPDSTPLLRDIDVPALVMVGREDLLTPPAEAQRMVSAIRHARLVEIDGAGHLSNIENPEVFNRELQSFLDGSATD